MITLIKKENKHYTQIFQSINLLFSFVTKKENEYTQLFFPVKCRDFLGDVIWSKKSKQSVNIYSFSYDYKETPYDEDMLRLSLTFPDTETLNNFKNNLSFLLYKLPTNTIPPQYFETYDTLTLIIEANPIWQLNSWKLSLFTYYLKLMCYKDITKPLKPEVDYAAILTPEIENKLLSQLNNLYEQENRGIDHAHNYSGFVSIIKNQNTEMNQILLGESK